MGISKQKLSDFKKTIWDYYKKNKRDLPWRGTTDPYKIVVSEVMLQQTQVARVVQKYAEFIKVFPTFNSLAVASKEEVLRLWQGMGYNRRALYLKALSAIVIDDHKGRLPNEPNILMKLPAIGSATAGSIAAFAFNKPTVFLETNIRRVFLHFFFQGKKQVSDKDILPLVEKTLDKGRAREWYWALMDYGTLLVKTVQNPNRNSKHYVRQSPFSGSDREIRGAILKLVLSKGRVHRKDLSDSLSYENKKITFILNVLVKEGFLVKNSQIYTVQ